MSLNRTEGPLQVSGHQLGGHTMDVVPRLIGRGTIVRKDSSEFVPCKVMVSHKAFLKIGCEFAFSTVYDRTVIVFEAHVHGSEDIVGRCSVEILPWLSQCKDKEYRTQKVVSVLNVEAPKRNEYQGIGTLLIRAAMEYGVSHDTEGRIAVLPTPEARGFYSKIGMQSEPEGEVMYLPRKEIATWMRVMMCSPILYVQK